MDLQNPNFWAAIEAERGESATGPQPSAPPIATGRARSTVLPRGWEKEVITRAAARVRRLRSAADGLRRTLAFLDRFSPRISSRAYHTADSYLAAAQLLCDALEEALAEIGGRLRGQGSAERSQVERHLDQVVGQLVRLRASASSALGEEQPPRPTQPPKASNR